MIDENGNRQYCMALIFDYQLTKIALIKKIRSPKGVEKMIGKWNGIGGNVEPKDNDHNNATRREFREEAKIRLQPHRIIQFGIIIRPSIECSLWAGKVRSYAKLLSITNEPVEWHSLDNLPDNLDIEMRDYFIDGAIEALKQQKAKQPVTVKEYIFPK